MRTLILGAGGTGGYFGGRLAQSGADITFLVRAPRAAQLREHGLQIRSPLGDANVHATAIVADELAALAGSHPFDMVLLSCKAYDLESALDAIAPAVTAQTTVMPVLNGLGHYAALDQRFGRERVLGGLCFISATKGADGQILHLGRPASMTFGERDSGVASPRAQALAALCEKAGIEHTLSTDIAQDQWIKFSFLAALAAGTCLMRASVGQIVATAGGADFMIRLYAECVAVAGAEGHAIPPSARDFALGVLTQPGSEVKASMLRDLQAGQRVEAAHLIGDLQQRARLAGIDTPMLDVAWCHLQAYQAGLGRP